MKDNITHNNFFRKSLIKGVESINDLRDLEYKGVELSPQQRLALKNYDRYRINQLNSQTTEHKFHQKYLQLQVMANLSPYEEFLKEEYYL
jgi:hypothetical protein